MGVLVNTNVFLSSQTRLAEIIEHPVFTCDGHAFLAASTAAELLTGVHMAKDVDSRIKRSAFVEGIIGNIPIISFSENALRCYAELYAVQAQEKRGVSIYDLQVAATAVANDLTILTAFQGDFDTIPGVKVEYLAS